MAIKAIAVLELDRKQLLSCPLDELELEPTEGSLFLYKGNLYKVEGKPIVSIGSGSAGARKSLNMQIAEVLSLTHGDGPEAIGLFQSLKSIADGAADETKSASGMIVLPSKQSSVQECYDRLVYIRLKFEAARPQTDLIRLLEGDMSVLMGATS